MKYIRYIVIFSFIIFFNPLSADPTKGIEYITENFPPYNYKAENGEVVGINVDILLEMFKKMGSDKTQADIHMMPWKRGYGLVQTKGKKNVLFSMTRTEVREHLFKWVGPLSTATNALIILKGNPENIKFNDMKNFKNHHYGAVKNDIGEFTLINKGIPKHNINTSSSFKQMLKKLKTKRIVAMSYNWRV